MPKKITKRISSLCPKERIRFYHNFAALYGDNLTTKEDFDTAYTEYTGDNETKFTKETRDYVKQEYFNRPKVKERLGYSKQHFVTSDEVPMQATPTQKKGKVKKYPFAREQKARYEYLGRVKEKTVYTRRTSFTRRKAIIHVYRDKMGRFAKVVK